MGQADFEGCKRVFNASNGLAANTRNATAFHRHQAIEEHFAFWDEDKYANLSRYLQNHYRAVLAVTTTYPDQIRKRQAELGISNDAFAQYIEAKKAYLRGLHHEPVAETLQFQYIEALDDLTTAQTEWSDASKVVKDLRYQIATKDHHAAVIKVNRKVGTMLRKLNKLELRVASLEDQLGLTGSRWDPTSQEYLDVKAKTIECAYRKALDALERLAVQRLFELSKLNMSGTGYKLRMHIAKALQRRSTAIRNTLARYNFQAQKLSPPRPQLTWKEIVDYSFLGEFDLLRQSRSDIRGEKWTDAAHRDVLLQHLQLLRSREELLRCNDEIRRLRTFLRDEEGDYQRAISFHLEMNPALATEIKRRWAFHEAVNTLHESRLQTLLCQSGYTGRHNLGDRVGREPSMQIGIAGPSSDMEEVVTEVLREESDEVGDEAVADVITFEEFIYAIPSD